MPILHSRLTLFFFLLLASSSSFFLQALIYHHPEKDSTQIKCLETDIILVVLEWQQVRWAACLDCKMYPEEMREKYKNKISSKVLPNR